MYTPRHFEESRIDVLQGLMRARPLATLITVDESTPVVDHVPMLTLSAPAPFGHLRGHIARGNPLWLRHPAEREALAIFHGPQAYISPSLYPSKRRTGEVVPTWDYAVVHAHGTVRFIQDTDWLLELVSTLTDTNEAQRSPPWKVADAPADYLRKQLGAIVGFEFSITRLTGKWKVSQNRDAADRQGVVDGLRAAGDAESREIADMLAAR